MWRPTVIPRASPTSQVGASRATNLSHRNFQLQNRVARSFATEGNAENFLNGTSANYAEQMFAAWKRDPSSVHVSWNAYFSNVEAGAKPGEAFMSPPALGTPFASRSSSSTATIGDVSVKAQSLIRAYQAYGHLKAKLDPLGLWKPRDVPQLTLAHHGLSEKDLSEKINGDSTLDALIKKLESTYCQSIGSEYTHIFAEDEKQWIRERLEAVPQFNFPKEEKRNIYDRMLWADKFEKFLGTKYGQDKRFGLDGCEIMIPGMKAIIDKASDLGVENVVMGMPHRGRLNVLANVVRKPLEAIFKEFVKLGKDDISKLQEDEFTYFSGDVKYHMGTSYDRPTRSNKPIHLSLMSNPSHLEAVDPLACGKTRAKQHYLGDEERVKVLCLQLHGDAAFAGQGVVYETLQMQKLNHYTNGGTIHIVVNNQIGFTTDPKDGRSTVYCSDIAKAFDIPILHVNGDDSEAVTYVCELAAEYRQKFHKDVVIDLVCYRRFGHNELDNPDFTQPTLYKTIASHPSALEIYSKKLNEEGSVTAEEMKSTNAHIDEILEQAYTASPQWTDHKSDWLESKWVGFQGPEQLARIKETGVPLEMLQKVGQAVTSYPQEYGLHKTIAKVMEERKTSIQTGKNVDWATAEALAFGTLLLEGNHVRLSGQDVERGTFSHRHAVLHDQATNKTYTPLEHIDPKQAKFEIANSPLHEFGVMGFELGYCLENPNSLILWEAQFGDFANTAQVIIDQFLSAGEKKWNRQAGLVLLLPHGYDGQGPEHSSARLERFLQLHDGWHADRFENVDPESEQQVQESNMQIVNCTTPANYFHVLRRQVHREFRKPLVVMSPKSLLRTVKSPISSFDTEGDDTRFFPVIGDQLEDLVAPEKVRKLIFCSGQVYYALAKKRDEENHKDIAIVRIEQLAPFPFKAVMAEVNKYPNASLTWCQEEPNNMGAWWFVDNHFSSCLKGSKALTYVGRPVSASPAAGTYTKHQRELYKFLKNAMA